MSDLIQDEVKEANRRKPRRLIWWAISIAALLVVLLVGFKLVTDSREKPAELDMWHSASPTAAATPDPTAEESTATNSLNDVIGTNSDLTGNDVFDIAADFYPEYGFERIKKAVIGISQKDLETVRLVTSGQESAAELDKILQKYGFAEATGWTGSK